MEILARNKLGEMEYRKCTYKLEMEGRLLKVQQESKEFEVTHT